MRKFQCLFFMLKRSTVPLIPEQVYQRRIQKPVKHLRWIILQI